MKFIAVAALSLLSLASAVPHGGCTPATYQCSYKDGVPGWEVCDVSGKWIVSSLLISSPVTFEADSGLTVRR